MSNKSSRRYRRKFSKTRPQAAMRLNPLFDPSYSKETALAMIAIMTTFNGRGR
jgi:hypothetical protein